MICAAPTESAIGRVVVISKRRDFKQLEDFNVKKDEASRKYHEEYMRRMSGKGAGDREL